MVSGDGLTLTLGVSSPPTDRGRGSAQDASKDGFSQLCPHREVPETLHCTKKGTKRTSGLAEPPGPSILQTGEWMARERTQLAQG